MGGIYFGRVRIRTIIILTVLLFVGIVVTTGMMLFSMNEQYRKESHVLYDRMASESMNRISKEMVTAHSVLKTVSSDKSLRKLLTNTWLSDAELVALLREDILPMVRQQQLGLNEAGKLCIRYATLRMPRRVDEFKACKWGKEYLLRLNTCDDALTRYEFDAAAGVLYLYQPVYSKYTLELSGMASVEMDLDALYQEHLDLDMPVCVWMEDGTELWRNAQAEGVSFERDMPNGALLKQEEHYLIRKTDADLGLVFAFGAPKKAPLYENSLISLYGTLAVLVLLAILIIGVAMYGSFLKQLKMLIGGMERVAAGELDFRMQNLGDNELSRVAQTLNIMLDRMQRLIANLVEAGRAEKKAVYQALSNQLKPHFLNNALDRVRMKAVCKGEEDIADSLIYIMRYLSYNLGKQDVEVTLTDELCSVSNYVEMLHLAKDAQILLEIAPRGQLYGKLDHHILPKFTLQPIVENCVRHAFTDGNGAEKPRRIMVTLGREQEQIVVSVEDNGMGMEPERLSALREALEKREDRRRDEEMGVSLGLVRRRLELFYECEVPFTVDSLPGMGTMVTFIVPDRSERDVEH